VEVLSDAVRSAPADQTAATIRARYPQVA
jgi:hypothetical protein